MKLSARWKSKSSRFGLSAKLFVCSKNVSPDFIQRHPNDLMVYNAFCFRNRITMAFSDTIRASNAAIEVLV